MKKLALTLLLSLSIIVSQAGVLSTIKEAVSTVVSVEVAYIGLKWAAMKGLITLPHLKYY